MKIGFGGVYARPAAIEIRQLAAVPLHYLRFIYPGNWVDHAALWVDGSHRTTLAFAKRWVADEYQVTRNEWQRPMRRARRRT